MPNGFIDKNGNSVGMTSYIGYIPNKKAGVVILANSALKPDVAINGTIKTGSSINIPQLSID